VEQRSKAGEILHACVSKECSYKEKQEGQKLEPRREG
jgi:hypothetical protein